MIFRRTLCATALLMALPMGAMAQNASLLLNSFLAPQHPVTHMVIKPWAEKIGQVTEGRVKVDVAPSSLAAPHQQLASVNKGVFDIAYQFHGLMTEQVKLNQVAQLPFVNTTARGSSVALWRTYQKHFAKANELGLPQVPDEVKQERWERFMEAQQEISAEIFQAVQNKITLFGELLVDAIERK